jgi:hypothetical protein
MYIIFFDVNNWIYLYGFNFFLQNETKIVPFTDSGIKNQDTIFVVQWSVSFVIFN